MATDQPRCPLCGGASYLGHYELKCVVCGLPEKYWPRIRELVSIRDVAMELAGWHDLHPRRFDEVITRIKDLVRQEAKNVGPRTQPETPA